MKKKVLEHIIANPLIIVTLFAVLGSFIAGLLIEKKPQNKTIINLEQTK